MATRSAQQLLTAFLEAQRYVRGLATLTLSAYRTDLEQCLTFCTQRGVTEITHITTDVLVAHLADLRARGYAETSLLRHAASLKAFFTWLLEEDEITQNPTDILPSSKRPQALPRTIDEQQLCHCLEQINGDTPKDLRDRAILELLYGCGLRCAELCGLTLHDVDFNSQRVRIFGKGKRERVVPFGEPAERALKRYLTERTSFVASLKSRSLRTSLSKPEAPFFLTPRGKRMNRSLLSTVVRIRIRAQLPGDTSHITPHVLRHAFATHLLDHGAPLMDIRDLLGHATITTTQVYTHVSATALRETFQTCFPRA